MLAPDTRNGREAGVSASSAAAPPRLPHGSDDEDYEKNRASSCDGGRPLPRPLPPLAAFLAGVRHQSHDTSPTIHHHHHDDDDDDGTAATHHQCRRGTRRKTIAPHLFVVEEQTLRVAGTTHAAAVAADSSTASWQRSTPASGSDWGHCATVLRLAGPTTSTQHCRAAASEAGHRARPRSGTRSAHTDPRTRHSTDPSLPHNDATQRLDALVFVAPASRMPGTQRQQRASAPARRRLQSRPPPLWRRDRCQRAGEAPAALPEARTSTAQTVAAPGTASRRCPSR
jgi:hypothetical protein